MFEEAGWRVVPFAMQHPENLLTPHDVHFVEELEFGATYTLAEKLKRAPKVVYSFEARQRISEVIDAVKPDVCILHNIYHHLSPSILPVLKAQGIPVVLVLHDLKLACPAYKMLTHDGVCERCRGGALRHVVTNRCVKDSLLISTLVYVEAKLHRLLKTYKNNVDAFVTPSKFLRDKLFDWGWSGSRMEYVSNFVNAADFRCRTQVGKRFVYFGRLSPEKGIATLIDATRQVGVGLDVIGTGPLEDPLKEYVGEHGVDVRFAGFKTGTDLFDLIAGARAVVLPSEWYENAPISILESYALGVPVIGADIGGIPEMILPDVTGDVFRSGSVDELAGVLQRYTEKDDSEILKMGTRARQLCEEKYSRDHHFTRLREIFSSLGVAC